MTLSPTRQESDKTLNSHPSFVTSGFDLSRPVLQPQSRDLPCVGSLSTAGALSHLPVKSSCVQLQYCNGSGFRYNRPGKARGPIKKGRGPIKNGRGPEKKGWGPKRKGRAPKQKGLGPNKKGSGAQ